MTRTISTILALVFASSILLSSFPNSVVGSFHDERITAPVVVNTDLTPGSRLIIAISVFDIGPLPQDLDGWEVHLTLNASILQITRVVDGPLLDNIAEDLGGFTLDTLRFNATAGTVDANELLIIGTPQIVDAGFTGSGDLLYIDVQVVAMGQSTLALTETKLRDVDGVDVGNISHRVLNGVFANVGCYCPPIASFTVPPPGSVVAGTPATFDASASYDLDGNISQYHWDFGDSSQATETDPVVIHTYAVLGEYNITLTVTDNDGITDIASRRLIVEASNLPPVAVFSFTPANPEILEPVTFNATGSYDPDGQLAKPPRVAFRWDFGDGSTGGGRVVQHTYQRAGIYTVILTVEDDRRERGTAQEQVTVSEGPPNEPPVASFTFEPTDPHVGETVRFDATSSFDPDGFIAEYSWNFGDGGFGALGQIVYHTYFSPGTFAVTLQVRDNRGQFASTSSQITVAPRPEHDVGIDDIIVSPSGRLVSGQFVVVTVIVENVGSHDENVTVRAFYDGALIGSVTQRVFGSPFYVYYAYITIFWDTSGVAAGEFTISAEVQIDFDEDPSNNVFTDGQVTILPPPRLDPSPPSGPIGTKVTVSGTGLPENPFPQGPPRPILVSFDNQFLGYTFTTGSNFVFVFNVPESEPGLHKINALDVLTFLRVSTDFTVVDESALDIELDVGSLYFEGDTAVATLQVLKNGQRIEPTFVHATLTLPNGSTQTLNLQRVEGTTGLYRIEISIPSRNSVGTYTINVDASYQTEIVDSEGHAIKAFTVKTIWLSSRRIGTLSATGSLVAGVGLIVAAKFGVLNLKGKKTKEKVPTSTGDNAIENGRGETGAQDQIGAIPDRSKFYRALSSMVRRI